MPTLPSCPKRVRHCSSDHFRLSSTNFRNFYTDSCALCLKRITKIWAPRILGCFIRVDSTALVEKSPQNWGRGDASPLPSSPSVGILFFDARQRRLVDERWRAAAGKGICPCGQRRRLAPQSHAGVHIKHVLVDDEANFGTAAAIQRRWRRTWRNASVANVNDAHRLAEPLQRVDYSKVFQRGAVHLEVHVPFQLVRTLEDHVTAHLLGFRGKSDIRELGSSEQRWGGRLTGSYGHRGKVASLEQMGCSQRLLGLCSSSKPTLVAGK